MEDHWIKWFYTFILAVASAFVLYFFWSNLKANTPVQRPVASADAASTETRRTCSEVMLSCLAKAVAKLPNCDKNRLRRKLDLQLSNALRSEDCEKKLNEAESNCPKGCRLDYSRMMIIPAGTKYFYSEKADESGNCSASADMPLSISAQCIELPSLPVSSD